MPHSQATRYELERFYPGFDRQKYWELFVDNEGWTTSDILPGTISIVEPGEGHPQGTGAVRSVRSARMTITEDVVGFRAPEYFSYASRNGSMPVNDFAGELHVEERESGVLARSRGGIQPQVPGHRMDLQSVFRSAQRSAFRGLGHEYEARHRTRG